MKIPFDAERAYKSQYHSQPIYQWLTSNIGDLISDGRDDGIPNGVGWYITCECNRHNDSYIFFVNFSGQIDEKVLLEFILKFS